MLMRGIPQAVRLRLFSTLQRLIEDPNFLTQILDKFSSAYLTHDS